MSDERAGFCTFSYVSLTFFDKGDYDQNRKWENCMTPEKEGNMTDLIDRLTDMMDEVADKVDLGKVASSVQDVLDKTDLDEKITEKGIDLIEDLFKEG